MVKKLVVWTERAKTEKRIILQFWVANNGNNSYSLRLNAEFTNHAQLLAIYNHLGKPTDHENIRVSIINNFSLFYKIEIDKIIIVGVWDNRRNPDDLDLHF